MTLPVFNATGDLPEGVHRASLDEVTQRFGDIQGRRYTCLQHLRHVYALAQHTGFLDRFIIFGSFITNKRDPNDIDVVLVMNDQFQLDTCPIEARAIFDHAIAQARYGASIFWIKPKLLMQESLEVFVSGWQIKRDGSLRGIVEVIA